MKAAILISGYLRSFKSNVDNIKALLIDKLDEADVYIHITKNESVEDKYLNIQNFSDTLEYINKILNPKAILCEENRYFVQNKKQNDLYNTWYKFYKLNKLKKEEEALFGKYDVVVKTRPDIFISNFVYEFDKLNDNMIILPKETKIDKTKLTNIDDQFICDIFAYGCSTAMDKYFDVFLKLNYLIANYGCVPETVLFNYLKDEKINLFLSDIDYSVILSQCNVFAICGDSGSGKSTLANLLKNYFSNSFILECDRYHKWERNDPNWSSLTHLNPDANYITKMHEDIFNLKIGNMVYQVDYNHSTGKFTEKQAIESADNIIVCGLHSLYGKNDHIYNFSIFMDTDDSLKHEWKIQRDIQKRGYTKEQILKQIDNRKSDYVSYIEPQKHKSDIIVKFYKNYNDEMCLKILINKKHSLSKILGLLVKYQIPFSSSTNDNFIELNFENYVDCELWIKNLNSPNKYYDYILFIILNL